MVSPGPSSGAIAPEKATASDHLVLRDEEPDSSWGSRCGPSADIQLNAVVAQWPAEENPRMPVTGRTGHSDPYHRDSNRDP